ncbi:LmeA family phospholipid-binding protein [Thermobifida cellulosilytica]|jgi:hypothetical protein|uniref:DUF2993 domain-containing protein n=1 Tax=Thermobifida cellulosilytica TB100 TaxID=665004 RepID=A0A147KLC5_THECS|nr:DUF2993 domain-containing protein [Thermobifida cellulosilytica]KUP98031.1 hypothetical protein AC529_03510 [Thermobifida cellulosilytica TB100]
MRKVLVLLIFLLVLLVAADRGAHYAAESEIAKRISQQYDMASEPEVTIGGFPFLHQAIGGEYQEIHVVTGAMTVEEVQVDRVDVTLTDVRAPFSDLLTEPNVVAGGVEGTVLLPYSELQKRLPEGVVIEAANGAPRMSGDLAYQGFSASLSSGFTIEVDGDELTVTPQDIELGEDLVPTSVVESMLTLTMKLPRLPFDLEVTDVELLPNGIQATAVGSNVQIVGSADK